MTTVKLSLADLDLSSDSEDDLQDQMEKENSESSEEDWEKEDWTPTKVCTYSC